MKNIALIGATGSVGEEIFNQLLKIDNVTISSFTRKNLSDALNNEYDIVICAAPSSGKLKTNLELDNSDKDIEDLCRIIKEIKTNRFMYRPQKVRPKNLTFWRSVFLWVNIILNLKRKSY